MTDRVDRCSHEVGDGVWVRQSEWVWSNAIAVRGEGGLILVDPGIDGSDLDQLADGLDRQGREKEGRPPAGVSGLDGTRAPHGYRGWPAGRPEHVPRTRHRLAR